jgi:serine/threonine protein kinase/formylglycine-generating enzyme required for sulfatase activity
MFGCSGRIGFRTGFPGSIRMPIRCPHCHNAVEIIRVTPLDEVVCPLCGSRFNLISDPTVLGTDATTHEPSPERRRFSHFELIERLGMGAFGSVWKARDLKLDRDVAVKIPRSGGLSSSEADAFLREARAAAQLKHPNIVAVHEVGRDDGTIYIVSDFVRGVTLASWLTGQQPTQKEAAEICAKIADALHHAHEAGVVHRDLKPSNVMLDGDGEPHILDFGLAKRDAGEIAMTVAGNILGTPAYMSPEQATGKAHEADRRSDIYSLGVILFELLTGELPFRGDTHMLIHQVATEEPPSPRKLKSRIAKDLETICLHCMEKKPERRYGTANGLSEDLRRWLHKEPIKARPIGRVERTVRWCQRNPALAGFVALLVLAVGGLATTVSLIVHAQRQQTLAQIESLLNAEPSSLPTILDNLKPFDSLVVPKLKALSQGELTESQHWRLCLALLPSDPGQTEFLRDRLLKSPPSEFQVIRDALWEHRAPIVDHFWAIAEDKEGDAERRFRAVCALAGFSPDDTRWGDVAKFACDHLVTLEAAALVAFRQALAPAKGQLIKPLASIFRDTKQKEQARIYATETLAVYLADRPDELFDLLADSEQFQFPLLIDKLTRQKERAVALAQNELSEEPPVKASEDQKESQAKRRANAAIALLRLGATEKVWPALQFNPDPRVRTYIIHRLGAFGGDPRTSIQRLDTEPDVTIRRALVLMLGEFTESQLPRGQRQRLVERLLGIYENEPDAGLHGATEWVLRTWGQAKSLDALDEKLGSDEKQLQDRKSSGNRQWYVNTQKQTFVIVDAGEFLMGSPDSEPDRYDFETRHRCRIGRRFAISAHEVTKAQYRTFQHAVKGVALADWSLIRRVSPTEDSPQGSIMWFEAAHYCDWLSEHEGIAKDQWCYEPNKQGKYGPGMKAKDKFWELKGYRLPTEAEWEYASRAGTVTSRYYGSSEMLLPKYGWFGHEQTRPVGTLKPNDLGLFDMLGNVIEWCFEGGGDNLEVDTPTTQPVEAGVARASRGGSFPQSPSHLRSAMRNGILPGSRDYALGFRPARTFP